MDVQHFGLVPPDGAMQPECEERTDRGEGEVRPDRTAHEPRRVFARIAAPAGVDEHRHFVARGALRVDEVAEKALHAPGNRWVKLPDVKDSHCGHGIA